MFNITSYEFIFILVLLIVFLQFNEKYKKKHNNKSILEQEKIKKITHTFTLFDIIIRFTKDIFIIS